MPGRKSISISGTTYEELKEACHPNGLSMSSVVEAQIRKHIDVAMPLSCRRCRRLKQSTRSQFCCSGCGCRQPNEV